MAVLTGQRTCQPWRSRPRPGAAAAPDRATSPVDSRLDRTQDSIRSTEDPMTHAPPQIGYDDFLKVDVRVGRIVQVDDFPKAKKRAYQLRIDFGELGVKTSSAQLTRRYQKEELAHRLVLAVVNFPPRQIDRKSTRLNSSHGYISYAVFCFKKKKTRPRTADR